MTITQILVRWRALKGGYAQIKKIIAFQTP